MLHGWFNHPKGQPFIGAELVFPRLAVTGSVEFLVDTGADRTALMPADWTRIGVSRSRLTDPSRGIGVGRVGTKQRLTLGLGLSVFYT